VLGAGALCVAAGGLCEVVDVESGGDTVFVTVVGFVVLLLQLVVGLVPVGVVFVAFIACAGVNGAFVGFAGFTGFVVVIDEGVVFVDLIASAGVKTVAVVAAVDGEPVTAFIAGGGGFAGVVEGAVVAGSGVGDEDCAGVVALRRNG